MARRNDHTKEQIIKMVTDTGLEIIKESGFPNFSTRKIAKIIGYNVATLYNNFGSYDNIMFSINSKTLDEMRNFIKKNNEKGRDALPGHDIKKEVINSLEKLAYLYIDFATKNYNGWSALFEFRPKENPPEYYTVKIDNLFSIIKEPFSLIIKDSEAIENHIRILWASIHGICTLNLSNKLNHNLNDSGSDSKSAKILASILIEGFIEGIN